MKKVLTIIGIVIIAIIILAITLYILGFRSLHYAQGINSMYPTISGEEICLCLMKREFSAEELHPGMIVLFKHKGYSYLLTKRIIATGGDLIEIRGLKTFVNGKELDEPYIRGDSKKTEYGEITKVRIPPNKLFVMGDNRDNSLDSRYSQFGLIDISQVEGKPLLILWSSTKQNIGKWLQ